jgi:ferric-dicitrate binding protein FerR (iron transport regulator)
MQQQRLWDLLGKKLAGEASTGELEELQGLLNSSPELNESVEMIETFWKSSDEKTEYEERETALERHLIRMREEGLMKINDGKQTPGRSVTRVLRLSSLTAAAAAVIIFLVKTFTLTSGADEGKNYKTLQALNGSKNHFILPDGSKVWLNAGTTLKYSTTIDKDSIREVFLSGEAFFEIRHNVKHPFWIRTKQMDILDIGTEFNVKAYPQDETAEATLIEGSIEVNIKDLNHTEVLSAPNEKLTVFHKEETFKLSGSAVKTSDSAQKPINQVPVFTITKVVPAADSLVAETAWMKDVLVFQNKSFRELAVMMERWYDVAVSFDDDQLAEYRFTGAFADETIEQALEQLQLIRRFDFSLTERKVTIKNKAR